jgi:hypothetical protein
MGSIGAICKNASGSYATNAVFAISVLKCHQNLLATKTIFPDGKVIPYDHAKTFRFTYRELDTLEEFAKALEWLADEPRMFIIRGQLLPGLSGWQTRRLKATRDEPATIECPSRSWIVLDFDSIPVPEGLGLPDKVAEAGYYIRDNKLPSYLRGIRCVAAATSSTGLTGAWHARLRLFFLLKQAIDNHALYYWADALSRTHQDLKLDPSVMEAQQPIYTARPIFEGCCDPVPKWSRVRILDGYDDYVDLDIQNHSHKARKRDTERPALIQVCEDMPDWMSELAIEDAGKGVHVLETSSKAWTAIKRAFDTLKGCPKPGGQGRHKTLTKAAWELACLVAEGELPKRLAIKAYLEAAKGINNSDGHYSSDAIKRRLRDAFVDCIRS